MVLKRIRQWLPWIWLALCFVSFCAFLHFNVDDLLDSDMATEMELARHMIDIGKWFSEDWLYGNEIRVFSIQLFYIPFFFIFDNWHYVRLFGTITAVLCLLASFYYLCRQLKIEKWFPLAASVLLFPLSEIYFYIILMGAMYLPHAIRSFLVLGLLIHYASTDKKKLSVWLLILLALVSFFSGLGGLRMLLLLFFPILFAAVVFFFVPGFTNAPSQSRRLLLASSLALVCALIGYVVNVKVLAVLYTFSQYDAITFSTIEWSDIMLIVNYWLQVLGYPVEGELFSSLLIHAVLSLILVFITIGAAISALRRNSTLSTGVRLLVLTHVFGMLLLAGIVCATNMGLHIRYLIPSTILLPAIIFAVLTGLKTSPRVKKALIVFVMILIAVCGVNTCQKYASRKLNVELKGLTTSLANDGYTEGYSTFWQGSTMTELSHGAIEMRVWEAWTNIQDITSLNDVLQFKSHATTVPQDKVFIILSKYYKEHQEFDLARWLEDEEPYWDTKDYLVYTFESYDELLNSVNQQVVKTYKAGSQTLLPAASLQPLCAPLYPGVYNVTVTGKNVDDLLLSGTHDAGVFSAVIEASSAETMVFRVEADGLLHDASFLLENSGNEQIEIHSFELEKVLSI